jgi:uncharacterized protein (TIGR00661 family)
MKILYGIQLTGNGHINRSLRIINKLKELGHQVEIMVSGGGNSIGIDSDYRFSGFQFKYKSGQVDWLKTIFASNAIKLFLDVAGNSAKWDLVISDFEPVSAWIGKTKKIKSISISNQNSPLIKDIRGGISKWFMKWFCPTDFRIGIDYVPSGGIFQPIIDFQLNEVKSNSSFVVYLPYFSQEKVIEQLSKFSHKFIFYTESELIGSWNVEIKKTNKLQFQNDLKSSIGVITHCGFSTTSEALIFQKKLWAIPLKGQWEQSVNSKSLQQLGVFCGDFNLSNFLIWERDYCKINYTWSDPTDDIVKKIFEIYEN